MLIGGAGDKRLTRRVQRSRVGDRLIVARIYDVSLIEHSAGTVFT